MSIGPGDISCCLVRFDSVDKIKIANLPKLCGWIKNQPVYIQSKSIFFCNFWFGLICIFSIELVQFWTPQKTAWFLEEEKNIDLIVVLKKILFMLNTDRSNKSKDLKQTLKGDPYKINNNKNKNILKLISFYDVKWIYMID